MFIINMELFLRDIVTSFDQQFLNFILKSLRLSFILKEAFKKPKKKISAESGKMFQIERL